MIWQWSAGHLPTGMRSQGLPPQPTAQPACGPGPPTHVCEQKSLSHSPGARALQFLGSMAASISVSPASTRGGRCGWVSEVLVTEASFLAATMSARSQPKHSDAPTHAVTSTLCTMGRPSNPGPAATPPLDWGRPPTGDENADAAADF